MSSNIKPTENDFFSWGCNSLFKGTTYLVKSTQAVVYVAAKTLSRYWQGEGWRLYYNVQSCSALKPQHCLEEIAKEAEKGTVETIYHEVFIDVFDRTCGVAPKLKRVHMVNDPLMIQELLHCRRGDELLDTGFETDLFPLAQTDTMLLCPYAQHRALRSPLELTFSKRTMLNERTLLALTQKAKDFLGDAKKDTAFNGVIQKFVFSSIAEQALGLDLIPHEKEELVVCMTKVFSPGYPGKTLGAK